MPVGHEQAHHRLVPGLRHAFHGDAGRRVVDVERSRVAHRRPALTRRVGPRVGGDDAHDVGAVRRRRRVPREEARGQVPLQHPPCVGRLLAVADLEAQRIVVRVARFPGEGLQPLAVDLPAEGRSLRRAGRGRRGRGIPLGVQPGDRRVGGERPQVDPPGRMDGDPRDFGCEVAGQIGGGDRKERGRGAGAPQLRLPLQVARPRTADGRAGRIGVRLGPRAPGLARDGGVAGARPQADGTAARRGGPPADRAPRGEGARVVHLGEVGAAAGAVRVEAVDAPRVRGRVVEPAVGSGGEAGDLPRRGPREEHRRPGQARDAVDLPVRAGADDHRAVRVDRRVVGGVGGRPPHHVPDAVRCDPVHGAPGGGGGCGGSGGGRGRRSGGRGRGGGRHGHRYARGQDRRGGSGCGGRLAGGGRDRRAAGRQGEDRTVAGETDRGDLVVVRVQEHEGAAGGIDAQHPSGRPRPGEDPSVRGHGERADVRGAGVVPHRRGAVRPDPVDPAGVAGARVQRAAGSGRQRPDVGLVRVEHRAPRAAGVDGDDPPVGRGRREDFAAGPGGQRLHVAFRPVEDRGHVAAGGGAVQRAGRTAPDPQRAVGAHEGPEERDAGLDDPLGVRPQQQTPGGVDGHVVGRAAEQLLLRGDAPEDRRGGVQADCQGRPDRGHGGAGGAGTGAQRQPASTVRGSRREPEMT